MAWRMSICLNIFKGGSSESAPGRGGRRGRIVFEVVIGESLDDYYISNGMFVNVRWVKY